MTPGTAVGLPWDHLGVFEDVYVDPDTGEEVPVVASLLTTQAEKENETLREAIRNGGGWPLPMVPFNVDARMAAQQAAFLVATSLDFPVDALREKANWPPQAGAVGERRTKAPVFVLVDLARDEPPVKEIACRSSLDGTAP